MSTLSPMYASLQIGLSYPGSGPESKKINKLTHDAFRAFSEQSHVEFVVNDLYELLSEAKAGEHESSLDEATFGMAHRFLLAFPKALPFPSLSLDNDGEVSFDWKAEHGRIFSVSLRADGRLSYAGRLALKRRFYGTETFEDEVPSAIIESVKKIYSA